MSLVEATTKGCTVRKKNNRNSAHRRKKIYIRFIKTPKSMCEILSQERVAVFAHLRVVKVFTKKVDTKGRSHEIN